MGMDKCKRLAREVIYWPGLNADVDKFLETCTTCTSNRGKQQTEPMKVWNSRNSMGKGWNGPLYCQRY